MKKVILSLAVCASAAAANAQSAGSILVYGNVGFNSAKDENTVSGGGVSVTSTDKESSFYINPGIGFCVTNNLAVGLNINFQSGKNEFPGSGTSTSTAKSNSFVVGPFVRYTKMMGEHFFAFGQFQAGYQHGKSTTENSLVPGSTEDKFSGFVGAIYPAIGIRISPCFSVTGAFGGLSYDYKKYDNYVPTGASYTDVTKTSDFMFNLGQQFTLGVQLNLGGHTHRSHHEPMDETRNMDTSDDEDGGSKKKKSRKDDDE